MYALIFNNAVVQVEAVQFDVHSALTWVPIPGATAVAPGWSYDGGAFAAPPSPPALTLVQQAEAAMGLGIAITSTGTAALDGTYACDGTHQGRLDRISTYIETNQKFPAGLSAMPWPDLAGRVHLFPTIAAFQEFASAVANYVVELDAVVMGVSSTMPAASATIA